MNRRSFYSLCLAGLLGIFSLVCDNPASPDPAPEPADLPVLALRLSPPAHGDTYATGDTITLFCHADRDSFIGPIVKEFSLDTGKFWNVLSEVTPPHKRSAAALIEYDTTCWCPRLEPAFTDEDFIGNGVVLRVRDYSKKYIVMSDIIGMHN